MFRATVQDGKQQGIDVCLSGWHCMASFLKAAFTVVLSAFTGMPSTSCAGSRSMNDVKGLSDNLDKEPALATAGTDNLMRCRIHCQTVRWSKP